MLSAICFSLDQSKILSFVNELIATFSVICSFFEFWTVSKWSISPFPNKPWFFTIYNISLLKTMREKEKLLITSNFSSSHSVFYRSGELSAIFIKSKIVVCKLFQSKNLSPRKWLRHNNC